MTTEQKAKAYDESLERAKKLYEQGTITESLSYVFPELKESEDERIKEAIIATIHLYYGEPLEDEAKEMIAWLEKQGKQKGYTFKSIPRLLDMIEPSDKAKAYCQKLIDTLVKEGYNTDAKIVEEVLKGWNGEDVPMAIMDEQKPVFEMKTAEESLGIDSATYNKIVDECIYGEQNPADKLEPKFHKGEWIVWKDKCYKVNYNGCGYELVDQDGLSTSLEYGTIDENAHIWDVTTDAKDGDVLSDGTTIFIFKDLLSDGSVMSYCDYDTDSGESDAFCPLSVNLMCSKITPTTKEQRDILFQKMHEAGWEFDFDKKVLKKIEQEPTDNDIKEALRTEYEKGRADAIAEIQNPAWSKEDESYLNTTIAYLKDAKEFKKTADNCINWLKSLRSQPKKEWSEEDEERIIKNACEFMRNHIDPQLTIYHEQTWCKRDEFIKKFCKYMRGE